CQTAWRAALPGASDISPRTGPRLLAANSILRSRSPGVFAKFRDQLADVHAPSLPGLKCDVKYREFRVLDGHAPADPGRDLGRRDMQLPDEAIDFNYAGCLLPHPQDWTPLAELQPHHLIAPERMEAIKPQMMQLRQQVLAERQMTNPPPKLLPLDSGFIDLPGKLLEQYRKKGDNSDLGRIILAAHKLKEEVDRVVVLGIGGSYLGARALFDALGSTYHNELPERMRMGSPRLYFEGNSVDNDSFQDLLDLLE